MRQPKDLTGKRFGRLVALEPTRERTQSRNIIWLCKCDCGTIIKRDTGHLGNGREESCGCAVKERMATLNLKHGGRNDRLYLVWMDMRRRCSDPNDNGYKIYGGRGIKVCDEWQDYSVFRDWALENGYDKDAERSQCTLDRIDVNGWYEPNNCRFVGMITQSNNRRSNVQITYNGKTQTLCMWARELGIRYGLLFKRVKAGWDFERAISEPSHFKPRITVSSGNMPHEIPTREGR